MFSFSRYVRNSAAAGAARAGSAPAATNSLTTGREWLYCTAKSSGKWPSASVYSTSPPRASSPSTTCPCAVFHSPMVNLPEHMCKWVGDSSDAGGAGGRARGVLVFRRLVVSAPPEGLSVVLVGEVVEGVVVKEKVGAGTETPAAANASRSSGMAYRCLIHDRMLCRRKITGELGISNIIAQ